MKEGNWWYAIPVEKQQSRFAAIIIDSNGKRVSLFKFTEKDAMRIAIVRPDLD